MSPTRAFAASADPRHEHAAIAARLEPAERRRGRGAATNVSGRFETEKREAFDDGWTPEEAKAWDAFWAAVKTTLAEAQKPPPPPEVAPPPRAK